MHYQALLGQPCIQFCKTSAISRAGLLPDNNPKSLSKTAAMLGSSDSINRMGGTAGYDSVMWQWMQTGSPPSPTW